MTFLVANTLKNLKRTFASPWSLAIWIGVPFLVGVLLSGVMGGSGGTTPKVHLLIADEDASILSSALTDALASDRFAEMLILEPVSTAAGQDALDRGDASALLIIPANFQTNYLTSTPQQLRLIVNPLQSILPEMAEELVRLIADFGSYAQFALGPELADAQVLWTDLNGNTDQTFPDVSDLAGNLAAKLVRIVPQVNTAPIEVEVTTAEGAAEATFLMLFFPGLLMMTAIFAAQGLAEDLWAEREMGTLRRLRSTVASQSSWLSARLVSSSLILAVVLLPLTVAGITFLDLPVGKLPVVLIWSILAGLMLMQLASLVQVLAPTRKAGALFSTLVFFPLLLVGGSFFPFENMPNFLAVIGRLTPNGMMLEPIKGFLIGTAGAAEFYAPLAITCVVSMAMHILISWRLNARFASE